MDDGRGVVTGILTGKLRVSHQGCAQLVVRVQVALAYAFVDGIDQ